MRVAAALLLAAAAPGTVFTMPAAGRLVEGVASDGDAVFVSSVLDRTITSRRAGRSVEIRLPGDVANPFGLAWDGRRHWLWIATDCPDLPGVAHCDSGALVAIDAKGRVRARYHPPVGLHSGDVSVGGGSVFVSDSRNGAVYRLAPGARQLETLVAPGVGKSAQGSALDPSGRRLIMADYSRGLFAIDLATKARTALLANGKPLRGLDGMVRVGDRYFAIYNGDSPGRLLSFRLEGDSVIDVRTVIDNLPDPTQIAVRGADLLIVTNAGWETLTKTAGPPRNPAAIVAVKIG